LLIKKNGIFIEAVGICYWALSDDPNLW
jgi:hypothetical protein